MRNQPSEWALWYLLGCETDGVWMNVRLRGALPHAVFYDPFRVWVLTINNNKCTFLIYIHSQLVIKHTLYV